VDPWRRSRSALVDKNRPSEEGEEIDLSAAEARDQIAKQRDRAADRRDHVANRRDMAADERDRAAEERDQAAEQSEGRARTGVVSGGVRRVASAREDAASDRTGASQDRSAGANARAEAALDRRAALADREASTEERASASADGLTGVYLRDAGLMELERDIARARRISQPLLLAFIDVDHLKAINDSRGHESGDRMLVEVANTLKEHLRPYDLVVRYGGDEFVCALLGLSVADATARFALVNRALAAAPEPGSVTVGLAELGPDDSPRDLIARADAALYQHRRQRHTRP
jgi:diguanylate cyclase (GGDEF)-like protein